MEMMIAIGIGAWFVFTGIVSTIAVFKSYDKRKDEKK